MTDYGLVSIITPSYNTAKFIGETIRSVQAQTYPNWEMIIVDDCSTDNTDEVVAEYQNADGRIKYFKNEKNSGAAVSRNKALREAKGRWMAFLDSDDLWVPEKLEKQLKFMVENGYHFSCTYREQIKEDGTSLNKIAKSPLKMTKFDLHNYCWIGCLATMYDADYVGLVQIEDIKKNNDYAIWLKVIEKTNCFCMAENLAKYRVRSGSISRHSYISLIKWHYRLWHEAEHRNCIVSSINTIRNLFFGVIKKKLYETNLWDNNKRIIS